MANMGESKMISIIYSTNRLDPQFAWFIDSLYNQTTEEDRKNIELIFVDGVLNESVEFANVNGISRIDLLKEIVDNRFSFTHSKPKPNLYQGEERKTQGQYFSPSNARNTGVILSSGEYLVFVDDVSILMPTWWQAVKKAAQGGYIVCGSYQKHFSVIVSKGNLIFSKPHDGGIDSRWKQGNDKKPVRIEGSQVFGCSLGIPVKDILEINGFDELCDSIGGEDYQLGIRLQRLDKPIFYDKSMFTVESEELHNQPYLMKREDRALSPEAYMERLKGFDIDKRYIQGNWDSSHMILDIVFGSNQTRSVGNSFDLYHCRNTKTFSATQKDKNHWFDNKPLIDME